MNCTSGPLKKIGNKIFDEVIGTHGKVIKPTLYQFHKGTRILNGNRYCVIEDSAKKFPRIVQVTNPDTGKIFDVQVRYKGQEYLCKRCNVLHVGPCEELKAYYEAKDKRRDTAINKKILSDSTLRLVDQTGLKADVECAGGARIGHIANILRDDPFVDLDTTEMVVVMGANNILDEEEDYDLFLARTYLELAKFKLVMDLK